VAAEDGAVSRMIEVRARVGRGVMRDAKPDADRFEIFDDHRERAVVPELVRLPRPVLDFESIRIAGLTHQHARAAGNVRKSALRFVVAEEAGGEKRLRDDAEAGEDLL